MSRIIWISAATLALLLGAAGVSLATQRPANNASPLVLDLLSRATAINDFVDTGTAGPSPGDLYVFSDRLFLSSAPNVQVGTTDGRCALVDPVAFKADCSFTSVFTGAGALDAGDVMLAGTLSLVPGTTSTLAIVGGTAVYRVARGDATVDLGPPEGPHRVTVNLVLDP